MRWALELLHRPCILIRGAHPCPVTTQNIFHGACQAGCGDLLGNCRATSWTYTLPPPVSCCQGWNPPEGAHPRCPATTRYIFHGACQAGCGHLLGRRAPAAPGPSPLDSPSAQSCNPAEGAHPRCPATTRYIFHGACQAGRGHLLGRRRASCALGTYSFCSPAAVGTSARVPWCNTSAPAAAAAVRAALVLPVRGLGVRPWGNTLHATEHRTRIQTGAMGAMAQVASPGMATVRLRPPQPCASALP